MADALIDAYDGLVCDLDGVVYAGPSAIPHAVDALGAAVDRGVAVVYATNNASRPADEVAAHLRDLGLEATGNDVINSSMAAATVLTDPASGAALPADAPVLAVGGAGVALALRAAGLSPLKPGESTEVEPLAVVQGYGPDVRASDLAAVAHAVQAGARWVATNTDLTLPTDRGTAPGNGSLVAAVRNAVDVEPEVVGKPMPTMYDIAAQRMHIASAGVLAVGDRLETDIEGANRGGYDSVLVLTGVHSLADAAAAPVIRRPTYVLADLRGLLEPYRVAPTAPAEGTQADDLPAARALLATLWRRADAGELTSEGARQLMAEATR